MQPGPRNLITDVAGLCVGNAADARLKSGVTVVVPDRPAVASCEIVGGSPGTRETDLLQPHNFVQEVHALVLGGGSAYGLDAASGVQALLRERGIGLSVRGQLVPIVPAAILFDLTNGGDKSWGRYPPYRELGYQAAAATGSDFALGTEGAGTGALTAGLKGGLGSASLRLPSGITIGALVAVNAAGSVTVSDTPHFWAAPFEIGGEFGGLGLPSPMPPDVGQPRWKWRDPAQVDGNTTIGIVATDAMLSKIEAKRLAVAAHDGFARAIWPSHTPVDGDLIFSLATGASGVAPDHSALLDIYAHAATVMARAIARGVHAATPADGDILPVWSSRMR